ncbi:uncharacterized protein LOC135488094 [Lineus longissimus]|uniref:uncharacterized protein LOC135488094 n=1 Tax=Lineus longissimus TaxID=88925 RepID=UPI002B4EF976
MSLEEQLIDLKVNLNLKGQILLNTWTELTSLLDTYQAKLAVKETQARVRYETNATLGDVEKLRSEMTVLKNRLTRTQLEVTAKDNTIFQLKSDLAHVQSKLIVTQQQLKTRSSPSVASSNHGMANLASIVPEETSTGVQMKMENDDEQSGKNGSSPQSDSWEVRDAETSSIVIHSESKQHIRSQKRRQPRPEKDSDSSCKVFKTESGDTSFESDMSMSESNNSYYQNDRQDPGEREESDPVPVAMVLKTNTDTAYCSHPVGDGVIPAEGTNLVVHSREQIPATEKILRPRRRCHLCYSHGRRKDTRFYCPACPRQPAFCNDPCFEIYHSKLHKVSIPQGENPTAAIKREFMRGEFLNNPTDGASNFANERDSFQTLAQRENPYLAITCKQEQDQDGASNFSNEEDT